MSTAESSAVTSPVEKVVTTRADLETPASLSDYQKAWQDLIDYKLIEWGSNADRFDDDDVERPSREIVQRAISVAESCRDQGLAPPNSVVVDATGGIVFELRFGNVSAAIHLWDDGDVELQRFEGTRLVSRQSL